MLGWLLSGYAGFALSNIVRQLLTRYELGSGFYALHVRRAYLNIQLHVETGWLALERVM